MTPTPPDAHDAELQGLREAIARCDRAILDQLRKRMELAALAGERKAAAGIPVVAKEVEASVLGRARSAARTCGVSEDVLEEIFRAVIRASVERQHRIGVERGRTSATRRVLIVGSAGGMGRWFRSFAELLGHEVTGVDPAEEAGTRRFRSLDEVPDLAHYDALVVAAPLGAMPTVLREVVERRPAGAVVELASIKSPLAPVRARARELGVALHSVHPMFGPGKPPYDPLTFVVCEGAEGRAWIERMFPHPYARWIDVPFDDHDPLMGWLLGLGHLTGMLFATSLERAGLDPALLAACASTTFLRQSATARSILDEDPALYLDIQHLNPAREGVYATLAAVLDEYRDATATGDLDSFRALLEAGSRGLGAADSGRSST